MTKDYNQLNLIIRIVDCFLKNKLVKTLQL